VPTVVHYRRRAVVVATWLVAFAAGAAAGAQGDRDTTAQPGSLERADLLETTRLDPEWRGVLVDLRDPLAMQTTVGAEVASGDAKAPRILPAPRRVGAAWRWANSRDGLVSAALIDTSGRVHELRGGRKFVSASVSKAIMLAAYLREHPRSRVDSVTAGLLESMITVSDNNAADAVYSLLGDAPNEETARKAGARSVDVRGYWSETYLSALDGARFMSRVRGLVPRRHRRFAMRLLGGITAEQRWGIPEGAGPGWQTYFKGGWRGTDIGQLVHQIAVLHDGPRKISLAILTDGNPSMTYGIETIEGIAQRLIPRAPPERGEH